MMFFAFVVEDFLSEYDAGKELENSCQI